MKVEKLNVCAVKYAVLSTTAEIAKHTKLHSDCYEQLERQSQQQLLIMYNRDKK